jgi:glycosyltransferase involved in cell wall biosynthesis
MIRGRVEAARFPFLASLGEVRYPALPRLGHSAAMAWLRDRWVAAAVASLIERARPVLLHAHTEDMAEPARSAARGAGIPCVVTVHGLDPRLRDGRSQFALRRIANALSQCNSVALVGEPLEAPLREIAGPGARFAIVPNGVDRPRHERPRPILERGHIRFVTVANLHEGKGIEIALAALAGMKARGKAAWSYRIIGDGHLRPQLEAQAAALGLGGHVRFVGALPHRRILEELQQDDVFLLPSYREAFGIAYLEAMAAGLVTVGVRGQGPSMFIEHGTTGFLVEPRSVPSLEDALHSILDSGHEALRAVAAAGARKAMAEFSWEAHAQKLSSLYEEVVRGPSA